MKNRLKLIPFCLALVLAAVPALRAEDAATDKPEQKRERGPGGRGPNLEQLAQDLGLTADQKAKIGPILKDHAKQMQEIRKNETLSREDKMAKGKAVREDERKQIAAILTPDQLKKFDERRERGPRGGGDHPPKGDKPDGNK